MRKRSLLEGHIPASLVVQGAIAAAMFNSANTEHVAFFVKLRPYLAEVRAASAYPDCLANLARVVASADDVEERMAIFARARTTSLRLASTTESVRQVCRV